MAQHGILLRHIYMFKPFLSGMERRVMSLYQFSRNKNNETETATRGSTFEASQS
jgi:hypothetical protein